MESGGSPPNELSTNPGLGTSRRSSISGHGTRAEAGSRRSSVHSDVQEFIADWRQSANVKTGADLVRQVKEDKDKKLALEKEKSLCSEKRRNSTRRSSAVVQVVDNEDAQRNTTNEASAYDSAAVGKEPHNTGPASIPEGHFITSDDRGAAVDEAIRMALQVEQGNVAGASPGAARAEYSPYKKGSSYAVPRRGSDEYMSKQFSHRLRRVETPREKELAAYKEESTSPRRARGIKLSGSPVRVSPKFRSGSSTPRVSASPSRPQLRTRRSHSPKVAVRQQHPGRHPAIHVKSAAGIAPNLNDVLETAELWFELFLSCDVRATLVSDILLGGVVMEVLRDDSSIPQAEQLEMVQSKVAVARRLEVEARALWAEHKRRGSLPQAHKYITQRELWVEEDTWSQRELGIAGGAVAFFEFNAFGKGYSHSIHFSPSGKVHRVVLSCVVQCRSRGASGQRASTSPAPYRSASRGREITSGGITAESVGRATSPDPGVMGASKSGPPQYDDIISGEEHANVNGDEQQRDNGSPRSQQVGALVPQYDSVAETNLWELQQLEKFLGECMHSEAADTLRAGDLNSRRQLDPTLTSAELNAKYPLDRTIILPESRQRFNLLSRAQAGVAHAIHVGELTVSAAHDNVGGDGGDRSSSHGGSGNGFDVFLREVDTLITLYRGAPR